MAKLYKYSVKPFSQSDGTRSMWPAGTDPCAICQRPVKQNPPAKHWAVVIEGGSDWGDEDSDILDAGYMGCHPVGSCCHRKYVLKG